MKSRFDRKAGATKPLNPRDVVVMPMSVRMSDCEIRQAIDAVLPVVYDVEGVVIQIGDYDDDPRELWEIPEVAEFCRKLELEGILGILKMPPVVEGELKCFAFPGIDAFGLFVFSRELANQSIDSERLKQFREAVLLGNAVLEERYGLDL